MRVGILQPFLFPWRGYFDFINSVDVFIFLDDVNLGGSSWVYRNYFKTANGLKYLREIKIIHGDVAARNVLVTEVKPASFFLQEVFICL